MSKFVERFNENLKTLDLNIKTLSERLNVSNSIMYDWVNFDKLPSVNILDKLCNEFNCSCDYLLGLTDLDKEITRHERLAFPITFKKLLKENNTNINKVSIATGIHTGVIYRWINETQAPNLESLIKLSKVLKCSVDELLGIER